MESVAMLVGNDLHLDVPGLFDQLFQVDTGILERFFRFNGGRFEFVLQIRFVEGRADPFSAPLRRSL